MFNNTFPRADDIRIIVNGALQDVLKLDIAYFSAIEYAGTAQIEIFVKCEKIKISPKRENIQFLRTKTGFSFSLTRNMNIIIQLDDIQLFLYGNKPESKNISATYHFKSGKIYEMGEIRLNDNENIYIEGGSIVRGKITAVSAKNIKIEGPGIIDNSFYKSDDIKSKTIYLKDCKNVTISDIILIEPQSWMVVLAGCTNVKINNLKELGEVISSDGIDIVGSNNIIIENSIFRNNDDCIAVKYIELESQTDSKLLKPIHDILVQNCIMFNSSAGNAMEIGHELRCTEVNDIVFKNIDIIRIDGYGAAFSIHAGDQAVVHNILYENIYVEHYYDKLIDFRVMCSRFNLSPERGKIENIRLKNIFVTQSIYNPGYSVSLIGGYDDNHAVNGIHFENFCLDGKKVKSNNMLDLHTKNAFNITYI